MDDPWGAERLADNWLGWVVLFNICGYKLSGKVIGTEVIPLANGIHEILTLEVLGDPKQIKVSMHRQGCKKLYKEA